MKYFNKLKQSAIVKNLSILVTGTILAQLIVISFQILLRRIYTPEEFGSFAVYMSSVGILVTISSLRYEQTIILPKNNSHSFGLLRISVFFSFIFSILLTVILLLFHKRISGLLHFPQQHEMWLFFIPLSVMLFSTTQALNFFLIKQKMFKLSATNKIVRRFSEGAIQNISGIYSLSWGLIAGDITGQLFVGVRTFLRIRKNATKKKISSSYLINRYKDFPIKNGIPALMNTISLLLPIIIINRKFSTEITGFFDLARMVLIIPLSLITASLSQVLLQRFTEKRQLHQSIKKDIKSTLTALTLGALLFGIVISLSGEYLFSLVFGKSWAISGKYAEILVWSFALKFIISPFNIIFTAFEKIGKLSVWQSFYFILIISLILIPDNSISLFLYYYLAIEILSYFIVAIMDYKLLLSYEQSIKHTTN